jgi:hypothetical protein
MEGLSKKPPLKKLKTTAGFEVRYLQIDHC